VPCYYLLQYVLLVFPLSCLSDSEHLSSHFWINLFAAVTVLCSIYLHYLPFNDRRISFMHFISTEALAMKEMLQETDTFNLSLEVRFIPKSLKRYSTSLAGFSLLRKKDKIQKLTYELIFTSSSFFVILRYQACICVLSGGKKGAEADLSPSTISVFLLLL
jgi:hypothetical protein